MSFEAITYEYDLNDRLLTELKDVDGWADDRLTVYGYDGTQQTSKSVHATETDDGLTTSDPVIEQTDTTYNLQGRMDSAEVSQYDSTGTTLQSHKKSTYEYDDSGIRVAKTELVDVNNDGDFDDVGTDTSERTDYHVDKRNPTGYAQVLEEMHGDTVVKSYTIGHDVFLEAVHNGQVRRLLKDGHGSGDPDPGIRDPGDPGSTPDIGRALDGFPRTRQHFDGLRFSGYQIP